jgi:hypothetical protein
MQSPKTPFLAEMGRDRWKNMKIRYYGFLKPNSALPIEKVRELISFTYDIMATLWHFLLKIREPEIPGVTCSHCGHDLKFILFVKP